MRMYLICHTYSLWESRINVISKEKNGKQREEKNWLSCRERDKLLVNWFILFKLFPILERVMYYIDPWGP